MLKGTWLESGLLYAYSVEDYIKVLKDFGFQFVVIEPHPITTDWRSLIDAVEPLSIEKMIVVGGHGEVYYQEVLDYTPMNWTVILDDSWQDIYKTTSTFQYLKDYGFIHRGLVTANNWIPEFKDLLFDSQLIDLAMHCYFPYENTGFKPSYRINMQNYRALCTDQNKVRFIPHVQAFKREADAYFDGWRFPSTGELQALVNDIFAFNSHGLMFFEPFSGSSERGETFEGYLDHSEVWDIIKNPQSKTEVGGEAFAGLLALLGLGYLIYREFKKRR